MVALPLMSDKIAHVQISLAYVLVVVASKLLLVSGGVEEGHVLSFFELVDRVLSSLLVCLLVVSFESRGPILEVCWEHGLGAVDHEEWGIFRGPPSCRS